MASFLKNLSLVYQSAALYRDENLKEAGVSGYQARYLLALSHEDGISQDALSKRLLVNKSNVARNVSALEEGGYIVKEQSGEDKRIMLVKLTQKGRELVPAIRAANARWREIVCKDLTEEQTAQLADIMQVMVKNARDYLENGQ